MPKKLLPAKKPAPLSANVESNRRIKAAISAYFSLPEMGEKVSKTVAESFLFEWKKANYPGIENIEAARLFLAEPVFYLRSYYAVELYMKLAQLLSPPSGPTLQHTDLFEPQVIASFYDVERWNPPLSAMSVLVTKAAEPVAQYPTHAQQVTKPTKKTAVKLSPGKKSDPVTAAPTVAPVAVSSPTTKSAKAPAQPRPNTVRATVSYRPAILPKPVYKVQEWPEAKRLLVLLQSYAHQKVLPQNQVARELSELHAQKTGRIMPIERVQDYADFQDWLDDKIPEKKYPNIEKQKKLDESRMAQIKRYAQAYSGEIELLNDLPLLAALALILQIPSVEILQRARSLAQAGWLLSDTIRTPKLSEGKKTYSPKLALIMQSGIFTVAAYDALNKVPVDAQTREAILHWSTEWNMVPSAQPGLKAFVTQLTQRITELRANAQKEQQRLETLRARDAERNQIKSAHQPAAAPDQPAEPAQKTRRQRPKAATHD